MRERTRVREGRTDPVSQGKSFTSCKPGRTITFFKPPNLAIAVEYPNNMVCIGLFNYRSFDSIQHEDSKI